MLDAIIGQNALIQVGWLTGLVLVKLDGTVSDGNVLSIAAEISVSIRYIGTGECTDDLAEFNP